MSKGPKVSVVMSVYNGERFLRESVESILNQTFADFEFLIINDGSTDASSEILEEYAQKDSRIKLIHQENVGLTKSLNKGIKLARGKYIARMDADDISDPTRFERQVEFLDTHPSIGVLGIKSLVIDEEGNTLYKVGHPISHREIVAKLLLDNRLVHSSVMLRKLLLETYGYYNESEDVTLGEDYELFLRLSAVVEIANLPDPLHRWRENASTGISVTKREAQLVVRDRIRRDFLEKHFAPNKEYANLVLANFRNNPRDVILSEYLHKILKMGPFLSSLFFLKLKVLYYLAKKGL